jgi:hypothetical protein
VTAATTIRAVVSRVAKDVRDVVADAAVQVISQRRSKVSTTDRRVDLVVRVRHRRVVGIAITVRPVGLHHSADRPQADLRLQVQSVRAADAASRVRVVMVAVGAESISTKSSRSAITLQA